MHSTTYALPNNPPYDSRLTTGAERTERIEIAMCRAVSNSSYSYYLLLTNFTVLARLTRYFVVEKKDTTYLTTYLLPLSLSILRLPVSPCLPIPHQQEERRAAPERPLHRTPTHPLSFLWILHTTLQSPQLFAK